VEGALARPSSRGNGNSSINAAVSGANSLNTLLNSGSLTGSAKQSAQGELNNLVGAINPNKGKFGQ
jgi:hypothetical protein